MIVCHLNKAILGICICSGPRANIIMRMHINIAQLCARMLINDIPDCDRHVRTYVHHENRSLIQSLALMRSAMTFASLHSMSC